MSEHFSVSHKFEILTRSNYHRYYSSSPIVVVVDIADLVVVLPRPLAQGCHRISIGFSMFLRFEQFQNTKNLLSPS